MKPQRGKGHIKRQLEPVDAVIGTNLRLLRRAAGVGMPTLGGHLDLSYQQLQKYETGTNRLAASTLYAIADYLKLSPLAFFAGLPQHDNTALLSSQQIGQLRWRDAEILGLLQNLDRDAKAIVLSVLRLLQ